MQFFLLGPFPWGLKVITRSNFGLLIQQKSSPHEGIDLAKIWISKMVYWKRGEGGGGGGGVEGAGERKRKGTRFLTTRQLIVIYTAVS